jgi:quinol monooxygenase YgiN
MINVVASIHIKEGRLSEFIEIFKSNIPNVLEEKGCIEYVPTIDVPTGLPRQELNDNVVTIPQAKRGTGRPKSKGGDLRPRIPG